MNQEGFSKWRSRLWPFHSFELMKLIPLFFMKFFISLIYGILTSLKDAIIVTEKGSGAEVIPILKGWIVLPIAILATIVYSKLSNIFKRSTLFYGILFSFLSFYFLYGFFLYPHKEVLAFNKLSDQFISFVGPNYSHWIAIFRYWMHSLFFVSTELWASLVLFLLFWGFANRITTVPEAKRYYSLFAAGGNLAAMVTGPIVWSTTKKYLHSDFSASLRWQVSLVLICGLAFALLHFFMKKYLLKNEETLTISEAKPKLSLTQSLRFIVQSKPLRYLAIMVIGYGLSINLIEVVWKSHVKMQYPNPLDYQHFSGTISFFVGMVSLFIAFFIGGNFIRFFGWRISAMVSPIIMGITGTTFLLLVIFKDSLAYYFPGNSLLLFIVVFGAFQNVLSKAIKYTFFDPTKEMGFIPLDIESQVKGKAAIDVVGSRLGKSGSSWLQVGLIELAGTGSVLSIPAYLLPILAGMVLLWLYAVKAMDKTAIIEGKAKKMDPLIS